MTIAPRTLVEIARRQAARQGTKTAFSFLSGSKLTAQDMTFVQLDERARHVAAVLRAHGVTKGQRVLVLYPSGLEYVVALLGCFYAGAVAVPTYPPAARQLSRSRERIEQVITDAGAVAALGDAEQLAGLETASSLGNCVIVDPARQPAGSFVIDELDPSDPAILQYSSGSTSAPKGIVLSHGNVVANERQIQEAVGTDQNDVVLSWLPPFHDMGLLGGILHPLFVGVRGILMAPESFIRKPVRWLRATTEHRASVLVAPNFAFDLCVRRVREAERSTLDLSSVRVALCGAEPISSATLTRFAEAYEGHGFDRGAIYPCYGLAEASIFVSGGAPGQGWTAGRFESHGLDVGLALPCRDGAGAGRELVSCGQPAPGTEIAIVDPQSFAPLPERNIGEVWLRGPSIASGYWQRPSESNAAFDARLMGRDDCSFLRTGDLGFMQGGQLFVTGRRKDLIIIRGRNHYPQDIERTVQGVDAALVTDAGVAFSADGADGERLVVVQEVDRRQGADADGLLRLIPEAVAKAHGVAPAAIVLIRRGTLQKTASGKVRRAATKARFEADELTVLARFEQGDDRASRPRAVTLLPPASAEAPHLAPIPHLPELDQGSIPTVAPAAPESQATPEEPDYRAPRESGVVRAPDWIDLLDRASIEAHLTGALARLAGVRADQVSVDEPMASYGADSVALAELTDTLEAACGVEVPASFAYDHTTIREMASAMGELTQSTQNAAAATMAGSQPQAVRQTAPDQVAIVGMACRTPGAASTAEFWRLLCEGTDAVAAPRRDPALRGPEAGGFLADVSSFDAGFFGISPREAERMDPRQRLLLEVAWEALEDACISPDSLADTETGVFVGACGNDYATRFVGARELIDADFASGNATSVIANRLSYFLNLKGPSVTIDSACASSLAAVHAAREAILDGTCDVAIAGGVNLLLSEETSVSFEHARALSRSGRCRPFSSDADGFVRAEAVGVVVLQRADGAVVARRPVRALVAGSAINHNGRSNGLMAPNGRAQQRVIRRALATAGLAPAAVDYVEAHGVGAPVADAAELSALGAALGGPDRDAPLWVGSAKSNIGHSEAASGIISLIKATLSLEHGEIPKNLHFVAPPRGLDLTALGTRIPTARASWPRGDRPRVAGVSAFGFGGANAHVVLKEAPVRPTSSPQKRIAHLAVLSARTPQALSALATQLREAVDASRLGDFCHTLNTGRASFRHRAAILAGDAEQTREQLRALAVALDGQEHNGQEHNGQEHSGREHNGREPARSGDAWRRAAVVASGSRRLCAVFGADGNLPSSTFVELWQNLPWAREVLVDVDDQVRSFTGASWLASLDLESQTTVRLPEAQAADIATLAFHRTQWRLLCELGITVDVVGGAGPGALSAACAAGRLSWRHAVELLLHSHGGPAPSAEQARPPRGQTTLAGDFPRPFEPSGHPSTADLNQWVRRQLDPARQAQDLQVLNGQLNQHSADVVLELAHEALPQVAAQRVQRALLPAGLPVWTGLLDTAGHLYTLGVRLDLAALDTPFHYGAMALPSYPFERSHHWLSPGATRRPLVTTAQGTTRSTTVPARLSSHPLLRRAMKQGATGTRDNGPLPEAMKARA